jgi:hypothetical protein
MAVNVQGMRAITRNMARQPSNVIGSSSQESMYSTGKRSNKSIRVLDLKAEIF